MIVAVVSLERKYLVRVFVYHTEIERLIASKVELADCRGFGVEDLAMTVVEAKKVDVARNKDDVEVWVFCSADQGEGA